MGYAQGLEETERIVALNLDRSGHLPEAPPGGVPEAFIYTRCVIKTGRHGGIQPKSTP